MPCGNFAGIRPPVADGAKPARIEVEHLEPERAASAIMRLASASSTAMPLPQLLLTRSG